ncbi:MAG: short-chain dehydrogenase [Planctomycetaceae bacterium]|nr:short-chain dehydrogenase [Planctomycetaceae bacterium]
MRNLQGKSALVTGAASGIGRAIALRLATERVKLYLLDVDAAGLTRTVDECKRLGVETIGRRCDLTQRPEITYAARYVLDKWGGVDLLVNNAGITYYGRTADMSAEHWDRLLAVNLHAPIHLTRELLPALLDRGDAHVLNVASVCGLVGLGRVTAYTTSKFALVGFSESLRAEYARRGLGVTALCPGFADTNLFSAAPLGTDRQDHKLPPKFLLATPEKIADRAIRGIRRNKPVVVVQPYARALVLTKRFAPWVLDGLHRFSRKKRVASVEAAPATAPAEHRRAA